MERFTIAAMDGYQLGADFTTPNKRPKGLVLINPAMGVRIRYYNAFANWLSNHGFLVFTYNYRGIGMSKPRKLRGFSANITDWTYEDFDGVTNHLVTTYPGIPRFLIGHSVGGQILTFSKQAHLYRHIILVSSGLGNIGNWSGLSKIRIVMFANVIVPLLTAAVGYFPSNKLGMFENLPTGVAREWAGWIRSKNYLFDKIPSAHKISASMNVPIHAFSFSDDHLAPFNSTEKLLEKFSGSAVHHHHLTPEEAGLREVGHFGFFKPTAAEMLWPRTLDLLEEAVLENPVN